MKPATAALALTMLLAAAPALAQVLTPPIIVPDEPGLKKAYGNGKPRPPATEAPPQDWSPSEQELTEMRLGREAQGGSTTVTTTVPAPPVVPGASGAAKPEGGASGAAKATPGASGAAKPAGSPAPGANPVAAPSGGTNPVAAPNASSAPGNVSPSPGSAPQLAPPKLESSPPIPTTSIAPNLFLAPQRTVPNPGI